MRARAPGCSSHLLTWSFNNKDIKAANDDRHPYYYYYYFGTTYMAGYVIPG